MGFQEELEAWIVTYLISHPNYMANPTVIISQTPRALVSQIESPEQIFLLLCKIEATTGVIQRDSYENFRLTPRGRLYFRKFIEPIFLISNDKKRYSQIIDSTEGTESTKKDFKKLMESIKNKIPDDAEPILIDFLEKASVEAIFYLIRLILGMPSAS